ncbi:MAG TPA: CBS domain-containing protein [Candidatus Evtepia faecigallinarum]|nr:CBS domain-containing protein [Candidatus Evtepia faecigallinarum]
MQVKQLMNPCVVAIDPKESAALAARLLARHNIGSLPVCTPSGALLGVVTDRDIVLRCVAAGEDPAQVPVSAIMSRRPAAVAPDADPRQAAQLMSGQQVRRLPVVDSGKVVGMLSLGDLAKCGHWEMEISRALTDISENIRHL